MKPMPALCAGCGERVFYTRELVVTLKPGRNQYGPNVGRHLSLGPVTWCDPDGTAHDFSLCLQSDGNRDSVEAEKGPAQLKTAGATPSTPRRR